MAWLYYNTKDAVHEFARKYNCDLALAEEYLKVVRGIRNQQLFYVTDEDGEWGEILFDFENGTAEIIQLADWDTTKTNRFANHAIAYLLSCENEKLPKKTLVAFEL